MFFLFIIILVEDDSSRTTTSSKTTGSITFCIAACSSSDKRGTTPLCGVCLYLTLLWCNRKLITILLSIWSIDWLQMWWHMHESEAFWWQRLLRVNFLFASRKFVVFIFSKHFYQRSLEKLPNCGQNLFEWSFLKTLGVISRSVLCHCSVQAAFIMPIFSLHGIEVSGMKTKLIAP